MYEKEGPHSRTQYVSRSILAEEEPRAPYRVVVVDDESLFRKLVAILLSESPAFVMVGEASDQEEALRVVESSMANVAVIDIWLKGVNGFEVARKLTERDKRLKVIMISGSADPEYHRLAVQCGAITFLEKEHLTASRVLDILQGV